MSALIEGFDYVAQRPVAMTRADWQEKYPPAIYQRRVVDGETFYDRIGGACAAEAYENIPAVHS